MEEDYDEHEPEAQPGGDEDTDPGKIITYCNNNPLLGNRVPNIL